MSATSAIIIVNDDQKARDWAEEKIADIYQADGQDVPVILKAEMSAASLADVMREFNHPAFPVIKAQTVLDASIGIGTATVEDVIDAYFISGEHMSQMSDDQLQLDEDQLRNLVAENIARSLKGEKIVCEE